MHSGTQSVIEGFFGGTAVRKLLVVGLAATALTAAGAAHAAPVQLENGYVEIGVSDYGTLGSDGSTEPGILFDPTGSGNYGRNDILTPGTPFEGYYVTSGAYADGANNDGSPIGFGSASPTLISATQASWSGSDGTFNITNLYTLGTIGARSAIEIQTTLTNVSDSTLTSVEFLRTLDPDLDVVSYGSYYTNNTVLSADQSCGTGPDTGQTICIDSTSSYTHEAGVSAAWSTSPATYLAGLNDGNGDYTIGLAFNLGDVGAGDSVTFDYAYGVGGSLSIAATPTPEPMTLALFGTGLVGLGLARRRRR
jgi:hypothetical protein